MWALTCYFNPTNSLSRYENYCAFRVNLKTQKIPLLTVELAFNEEPYVLKPIDDAEMLIQVRSTSVMWHKERLLNIGLKHLPENCEKVCWMDCDIIFQNKNWVKETSVLLDKYLVVFPYRRMQYHDSNGTTLKMELSFGSCCMDEPKNPKIRNSSIGTWGYACAMRLDKLQRLGGFYDYNIAGGGHRVLSYLMGQTEPDPWEYSPKHYAHLRKYLKEREAFRMQPSHIGAAKGDIVHLWHGSVKDRQTVKRYQILVSLMYDPEQVLSNLSDKLSDNLYDKSYDKQCYEFKPKYHLMYNAAMMDFFKNRKDDHRRAKQ